MTVTRYPVLESFAASPVASWFETREDALLTMRVQQEPHPEEHREAMHLEGWSH